MTPAQGPVKLVRWDDAGVDTLTIRIPMADVVAATNTTPNATIEELEAAIARRNARIDRLLAKNHELIKKLSDQVDETNAAWNMCAEAERVRDNLRNTLEVTDRRAVEAEAEVARLQERLRERLNARVVTLGEIDNVTACRIAEAIQRCQGLGYIGPL